MTALEPIAPDLAADAALSALVELAVLPVQLAQALRADDRTALLRARTTLGRAALILDRALHAHRIPLAPAPVASDAA